MHIFSQNVLNYKKNNFSFFSLIYDETKCFICFSAFGNMQQSSKIFFWENIYYKGTYLEVIQQMKIKLNLEFIIGFLNGLHIFWHNCTTCTIFSLAYIHINIPLSRANYDCHCNYDRFILKFCKKILNQIPQSEFVGSTFIRTLPN